MYGTHDRRTLKTTENNQHRLMTNLNSISSSLSSIDTISRRATNPRTSIDNLLATRRNSLASTSLLWPIDTNDRRNQNGKMNGNVCLSLRTALNTSLVILLLLTIARQVFDFLGQIWLQILINFFTIILIIVALFGVHQYRKSYLALFTIWSVINICWNFIIICIHTKLYDTHLTEDNLNFFTGTTSWWHSNGPGCLPHNLNSSQAATNNQYTLMQPYAITGCQIDYHLIESAQAAIHVFMSMLSFILCCYILCVYPYRVNYYYKNTSDQKLYHLNQIAPDRSRVDSNPYPGYKLSTSASLRRPTNRTGARSSQHSMSSMRSTRRRLRQASDSANVPSQRGSTSSAQKNYKTGSLSSRRSRRSSGKRSDQSSLTYATAASIKGDNRSAHQRNRLSSLSSADYLPSYQPPHSSNANLLNPYGGEVSSLDSYNNQMSSHPSNRKTGGNSNPTYAGSRFSLYSRGSSVSRNANGNYDNIYGENNQNGDGESLYSTHTNKHRSNQQLNQTESKTKRSSMRFNQNKDNGNYQPTPQPSNMAPSGYGVDSTKQFMNGSNGNDKYDHYSKSDNHTIQCNNNNNYDSQNHNGNSDNRTQHQKATFAKHHAAMKSTENDYRPTIPQTFTRRQSPVYFNSETPI